MPVIAGKGVQAILGAADGIVAVPRVEVRVLRVPGAAEHALAASRVSGAAARVHLVIPAILLLPRGEEVRLGGPAGHAVERLADQLVCFGLDFSANAMPEAHLPTTRLLAHLLSPPGAGRCRRSPSSAWASGSLQIPCRSRIEGDVICPAFLPYEAVIPGGSQLLEPLGCVDRDRRLRRQAHRDRRILLAHVFVEEHLDRPGALPGKP